MSESIPADFPNTHIDIYFFYIGLYRHVLRGLNPEYVYICTMFIYVLYIYIYISILALLSLPGCNRLINFINVKQIDLWFEPPSIPMFDSQI